MSSQAEPTVSIVINTDGRCESLARTLQALRFQTHRAVEICVVCGPVPDGTREYVAEMAARDRLKTAICDVGNLSVSRNLGIALAAGDYIAFIDDDAVPEPIWLEQLLAGFDTPDVAGVGGTVFQPDGRGLQFRFSSCDRFGNARHGLKQPADAGAFPMSAHFPHVMGTNAMFRRAALVSVGGFDEEYEYYLDEADLCCRMVDAGWSIRQRSDAPVHHKFLSGAVRDREGITVHHYAILKNQLYFSLLNGRSHATLPQILEASRDFATGHRRAIAGHVARGTLHPQALAKFEADLDRATEHALARGLPAKRRLPPPVSFDAPPAFLPASFAGTDDANARPRHVAIFLDEGVGESLATARERAHDLAAQGDFGRLIIPVPPGWGDIGVELQEGVWHHYVAAPAGNASSPADDDTTLARIAAYHPIDATETVRGGWLREREQAYA